MAKIARLFQPTIPLTELSMEDMDSAGQNGTHRFKSNDVKLTRLYGRAFPIVRINGRMFDPDEVQRMEIDSSGTLPRLYLTILSYDGFFALKKFPRDGGVAEVFISSRQNAFTPIRNNFLITDIESLGNQSLEGNAYTTIRITGVLDVPQWFGHASDSVSGTSFSALQKVANDTGLGFSSNLTDTNDSMQWIRPYNTLDRWVYDIYRSAYAGEDSFFDCFVDYYYCLNFVDMNQPFKERGEFSDALVDHVLRTTWGSLDKPNVDSVQGKLCLTNFGIYNTTNFYIKSYSILNGAGRSANEDGYSRVLKFFDRDTDGMFEIPVQPLTTPGSTGDNLTGRSDAERKAKTKHVWMGATDTDNVHDNYAWAQVNNFQSARQATKMGLRVELGTFNFNIYRGMRVPVLLIQQRDDIKVEASKTPGQEKGNQISYDKFLSGDYVVTGIKCVFKNNTGDFCHEVTLHRRDWTGVLDGLTNNTFTG